jgi:hypothetical protein
MYPSLGKLSSSSTGELFVLWLIKSSKGVYLDRHADLAFFGSPSVGHAPKHISLHTSPYACNVLSFDMA